MHFEDELTEDPIFQMGEIYEPCITADVTASVRVQSLVKVESQHKIDHSQSTQLNRQKSGQQQAKIGQHEPRLAKKEEDLGEHQRSPRKRRVFTEVSATPFAQAEENDNSGSLREAKPGSSLLIRDQTQIRAGIPSQRVSLQIEAPPAPNFGAESSR